VVSPFQNSGKSRFKGLFRMYLFRGLCQKKSPCRIEWIHILILILIIILMKFVPADHAISDESDPFEIILEQSGNYPLYS